jgi:hypothetical protein
MDSFHINRESISVSKAIKEVIDGIANNKELIDMGSEMIGLGYHTYCLGLEMQKDENPRQKELGRRMYEVGIHWYKQGENFMAIALGDYRSHAAD